MQIDVRLPDSHGCAEKFFSQLRWYFPFPIVPFPLKQELIQLVYSLTIQLPKNSLAVDIAKLPFEFLHGHGQTNSGLQRKRQSQSSARASKLWRRAEHKDRGGHKLVAESEPRITNP